MLFGIKVANFSQEVLNPLGSYMRVSPVVYQCKTVNSLRVRCKHPGLVRWLPTCPLTGLATAFLNFLL